MVLVNSDTISETYDTSKEYDGPDPYTVGYDEYKLDITLTYFWFNILSLTIQLPKIVTYSIDVNR